MRWIVGFLLAGMAGLWVFRRVTRVEVIGVEFGDDFVEDDWCEAHGTFGRRHGTIYYLTDSGVDTAYYEDCACEEEWV